MKTNIPERIWKAALPLVAVCEHRGHVLPVSQQPECGCSELSACALGNGQQPGRVTIADCLYCKFDPDDTEIAEASPEDGQS